MSTLLIADDRESILHSLSTALDSGAECFMLFCCSQDVAQQLKPLPTPPSASEDPQEAVAQLLHTLNIPAHKSGYRQLCLAVPLFAADQRRCLSQDIYPKVAQALGCSDWRTVERGIRDAISLGFKHRDPAVWARFFLNGKHPPSNKRFLSTLAEYL